MIGQKKTKKSAKRPRTDQSPNGGGVRLYGRTTPAAPTNRPENQRRMVLHRLGLEMWHPQKVIGPT